MYTYIYTVQYTHTYVCTYVMGKTLIHISNKQAMRTVNSDRGKEATAEHMSEQEQRETDKARQGLYKNARCFLSKELIFPMLTETKAK